MKTVYLLTYIWSDFETHYDTIGVYETKELAEKALKKYINSSCIYDEDNEVIIEEVLMNHFTWEEDNNGNVSRR